MVLTHLAKAEMIERAALQDLHDAADAKIRADLGFQTLEIGGALVSIAANDTSIVLNRVVGLGQSGPIETQHITAISAAYQDTGIARYFLHLYETDHTAALDEALLRVGLEQARGWMKFLRPLDPAPERRTDLTIREIGPEHGLDMGRIVAYGFDLSDAAIPALAQLPGRANWRVFMCFDGDTPAGCGSMFVKDGVAWLDWGATDPKFRRRGAQSALLAERIAAALDMGCDTLVTATGEAVEGDPQHSYHNIERAGFKPFKLRENFAPPKKD